MSEDTCTAPTYRTSETDPLRIATWDLDGVTLGLTFMPGKTGPSMHGDDWKRDLDTDLAVIRDWAPTAGIVVTMDGQMFGNSFQPQIAAVAGMGFSKMSIPPFGLPDADQIDAIDALARSDAQRILVVSERGMERGGAIIARLMHQRGVAPAAMLRLINDVRPNVISTVLQRDFIASFPENKDVSK